MTFADVFDDLDATLSGHEPDWESDPVAATDTTDAIAKLRLLARIEREIAVVDETYQAEAVKLTDWANARMDTLEARKAHVEASLAQFHDAVLRDDPKAKTIDLPTGTLKVRAQPAVWEFGPEFVAWAMSAAPDLVRFPEPVPAPDKVAAKKALTITGESGEGVPVVDAQGELVPGVSVTFPPVKHKVELS